jgi:hypothetical protein
MLMQLTRTNPRYLVPHPCGRWCAPPVLHHLVWRCQKRTPEQVLLPGGLHERYPQCAQSVAMDILRHLWSGKWTQRQLRRVCSSTSIRSTSQLWHRDWHPPAVHWYTPVLLLEPIHVRFLPDCALLRLHCSSHWSPCPRQPSWWLHLFDDYFNRSVLPNFVRYLDDVSFYIFTAR